MSDSSDLHVMEIATLYLSEFGQKALDEIIDFAHKTDKAPHTLMYQQLKSRFGSEEELNAKLVRIHSEMFDMRDTQTHQLNDLDQP